MSNLAAEIAALEQSGWTFYTSGRHGEMHHAERYWRGHPLREEGDDLARIVQRCVEHNERIASSDLTTNVEAKSGLANL